MIKRLAYPDSELKSSFLVHVLGKPEIASVQIQHVRSMKVLAL